VGGFRAASDIYAPVGGEIVEANAALTSDPGLVNREPYGQGWLFRVKPDQPKPAGLLSPADYAATLPH